jgi:hypothetical protein
MHSAKNSAHFLKPAQSRSTQLQLINLDRLTRLKKLSELGKSPNWPVTARNVSFSGGIVKQLCVGVTVLAGLHLSVAYAAPLATNSPSKTQKINLPPSADLHYNIKAMQSGLTIDGTGMVRWQTKAGKFSVTSESRANLFGKVLEATTIGEIDQFGLAPGTFIDKRFRKELTTTTFNRDNHVITFSASEESYPIKGGEQDRNSVIWQLISVARGMPARFKSGTQWRFMVAGQRDAEVWSFKVLATEKLHTPLGEINTVHILRAPPPDKKGQKLDIWLAPSIEWYPAQLRFTDPDGEFIEQTLESYTKT